MSGLEVIGSISAIITFLQATNHLYERGKRAGEFLETLHIAGRRLPVLLHTLQLYKVNFERLKDTLPADLCHALQETLDDCTDKSQALSEIFAKVTSGPADTESRRQRYLSFVRKRGKGNKIETLMAGITQDIQLLVNNEAMKPSNSSQNTNANTDLEAILTEIKELRMSEEPDEGFPQTFHASGTQNNHVNGGNGQLNAGSGQQINTLARVGTQTFNFGISTAKDDFSFRKPLGTCLDQAPFMPAELFIGRVTELTTIEAALHPVSNSSQMIQQQQRRFALGGAGGIGKTQIALAYAQTSHISHETVLWFNATTEMTLIRSFVTAAGLIFGSQVSQRLEGQEAVSRTREWLSDPQNSKWLLVFDNYDDTNDFAIDSYFPPAAHGAVLITSRRAPLVNCIPEPLKIEPLQEINESLKILETRSKRMSLASVLLAGRLGGLPLALATAGTYLQKRNLSFQRYLQVYEERWNIDPHRPAKLREYQERTLFTTWDVSYDRLKAEDSEAAQLLKILAYFDNQSLWYDLFHAGLWCHTGLEPVSPLYDVINDDVCFNGVMATLSDFSFLEHHLSSKTWSMHNCIHDWISASQDNTFDPSIYWYAVRCVVNSIEGQSHGPLEYSIYTPYLLHAKRLVHRRFFKMGLQLTVPRVIHGLAIAELLYCQGLYSCAESLLKILLSQSEEAFGTDHGVAIMILTYLGRLHVQQRKFQEAKPILERAREAGIFSFRTKLNLGHVYRELGNLQGAEQMYIQALWGSHSSPLDITTNDLLKILSIVEKGVHQISPGVEFTFSIGLCGKDQRVEDGVEVKLTRLFDILDGLCMVFRETARKREVKEILRSLLRLRDKFQGSDAPEALMTAKNLGCLYAEEGSFQEAEKLFKRVLDTRERLFAWDHLSVITTLQCLGNLYLDQNNFEDAESALTGALAKAKKAFGEFHELTLDIINSLDSLYEKQDEIIEQEAILDQMLAIKETLLGHNHPSTINTVARLGTVKLLLRRLDVAEQMFVRVLGFPTTLHALGIHAIENIDVSINLSVIYIFTMRIHDAIQLIERMHTLALQRHDTDDELCLVISSILETVRFLLEKKGPEGYRPEDMEIIGRSIAINLSQHLV
ncbi:NB-ARC [Penicillium camemberti]|uniref:NB-ARC n=1 Tax=Penicillium camemberti (strain FM 013) TaxID=1429867 RepID=A0A0G4PB54_PENC3|nr:NB-ARC [Penicillium camemberti]